MHATHHTQIHIMRYATWCVQCVGSVVVVFARKKGSRVGAIFHTFTQIPKHTNTHTHTFIHSCRSVWKHCERTAFRDANGCRRYNVLGAPSTTLTHAHRFYIFYRLREIFYGDNRKRSCPIARTTHGHERVPWLLIFCVLMLDCVLLFFCRAGFVSNRSSSSRGIFFLLWTSVTLHTFTSV